MVFGIGFASNTILSCFFLFVSNYCILFLISPVNIQIFTFTAKLAIPTGIPNKDA